jgi:exodeoxyribonuclease VII large subunit
LSPVAVLNRGYAMIYGANGQLLRNSSDTQPGDPILARLAHGTLEAEVTKISAQLLGTRF